MEKNDKFELNSDSAIHPKIAEYINRARGGENIDDMTKGLPNGMRMAVHEGLKGKEEIGKLKDDKQNITESEIEFIPPQYRHEGEPLDPEILEDMWIIPIYTDPEKTRSELERKAKGIEAARKYFEHKNIVVTQENKDENKLDELRVKLQLQQSIDENSPEFYSGFKQKHGSTGDDEYWWYEYRNRAAKHLKESGKFEWGKERIYFDVPTESFDMLRALSMRIAEDQKIPLAFKFRDVNKTKILGEDVDTRFVANFASAEDAARFFKMLKGDPEYLKIVPDRNIDYKGIRLDERAEYASSYREQRVPLERAANARRAPDGTYVFISSTDGREIKISEENYKEFLLKWQKLQEKLEQVKELFV